MISLHLIVYSGAMSFSHLNPELKKKVKINFLVVILNVYIVIVILLTVITASKLIH